MSSSVIHRICTICEAGCGIRVHVEKGAPTPRAAARGTAAAEGPRVRRIEGDPADPFSKGHLCPKAHGLIELQNDPDRVRTPLRRTPSGFEPIGWEEALDWAAQRLGALRDENGPDSVAFYRGNPTTHDAEALLYWNALEAALPSKNRFSAGSLDTWPRWVQAGLMYGGFLKTPVPDVDRCDYLLMLGANPLASNGSLMTAPGIRKRLAALRQRGGRLVVVDPRRSETAAVADEHLFVRPGSDAALLLAMVHVLFDENRVQLGNASETVRDLEAVRDFVREITPDRVAGFCGVEPETIRRLARELAAAPRGHRLRANGHERPGLRHPRPLRHRSAEHSDGQPRPRGGCFVSPTCGEPRLRGPNPRWRGALRPRPEPGFGFRRNPGRMADGGLCRGNRIERRRPDPGPGSDCGQSRFFSPEIQTALPTRSHSSISWWPSTTT